MADHVPDDRAKVQGVQRMQSCHGTFRLNMPLALLLAQLPAQAVTCATCSCIHRACVAAAAHCIPGVATGDPAGTAPVGGAGRACG